MRPYLVLTALVLATVAALGQQPFPQSGPCLYGCGPYVPLVTTPMLSLQTVSPNPVGATNATTGLIAGATNSTLSQIQGSTSLESTVAVWYEGGDAPLTTSQVHMRPEPVGREGHLVHDMHDGMHGMTHEGHGARAEGNGGWMFFTGWEHSASAADAATEAKGMKKAARVYTNDDVTRQNDKNGTVKYDGKTEKI